MDGTDPPDEINGAASVLMKRGIALAEAGQDADALRCFDDALALRRQLPWETEPLYGYGLAACCLNRGDALARLGGADRLADAIGAYDEGIAVARRLPLDVDARFPRRLAIGLQNRAIALRAQRPDDLAPATAGFMDAIEVLEQSWSSAIEDRARLLATVWVNVADTHAPYSRDSSFALAFNGVDRALALLGDDEQRDADAAAVGLKARHVRCVAIAVRISSSEITDEQRAPLVHEATDTAEEALAIVGHWEQRGVARFRGIAADLLRFGAQVYATFQPQFLREFVSEHTQPTDTSAALLESDEMREAIADVVELLAAVEAERGGDHATERSSR
jgi:hypothetical protein